MAFDRLGDGRIVDHLAALDRSFALEPGPAAAYKRVLGEFFAAFPDAHMAIDRQLGRRQDEIATAAPGGRTWVRRAHHAPAATG